MPIQSYPMLLEPRFDAKIWGGRRLETILGKSLPSEDRYGESLESDAESRVINGIFAGNSLNELIQVDAESVLGTLGVEASGEFGDFPLLAKFIDASDVLSVQVHPNDEEASPLGKRGKTEAWHVIAADPGATLITGMKPGLSRGEIAQAIADARLGEFVIEQTVTAGDTLLVPAGTTHAIGAGVLLYEIQQASDVTFRMYDWDRVDDSGNPRELHVRESLEVVRPDLRADRIAPLELYPGRRMLTACRYFALECWDLPVVPEMIPLDGGSFRLVSSISGSAQIACGDVVVALPTGQTALLPAAAGSMVLSGNATLLISYVPHLQRDVVEPLLQAGYAEEDIHRLAGMLGHVQTSK